LKKDPKLDTSNDPLLNDILEKVAARKTIPQNLAQKNLALKNLFLKEERRYL